MKQTDVTKVEFLLTLNDNIIVQRFLNVKNINPNVKKSYELYESVKYFAEELSWFLKTKAIQYLTENQTTITMDPDVMNTSSTDGVEYFNIYIKIADQLVSQRIIDGKLYPPKVRYTVDVRPFIKDYLKELTSVLVSENLTHEYLEKNLLSN
jgi:hypothetical protein